MKAIKKFLIKYYLVVVIITLIIVVFSSSWIAEIVFKDRVAPYENKKAKSITIQTADGPSLVVKEENMLGAKCKFEVGDSCCLRISGGMGQGLIPAKVIAVNNGL